MFTGLILLIFCLIAVELISRCFFTAAGDVNVDSLYNLLTNGGSDPVIGLTLFSLFLLFSLLLFCLPFIFAYYKYDPFYQKLKAQCVRLL